MPHPLGAPNKAHQKEAVSLWLVCEGSMGLLEILSFSEASGWRRQQAAPGRHKASLNGLKKDEFMNKEKFVRGTESQEPKPRLVFGDIIPWSMTPQIAQRPHTLDKHPYIPPRQ